MANYDGLLRLQQFDSKYVLIKTTPMLMKVFCSDEVTIGGDCSQVLVTPSIQTLK